MSSKKVLFSVLLPATGRTYDFWVPGGMQMQQVTAHIARAMELAEPSFFAAQPDNALMYVATGEIQDPNATVAEIGFSDGEAFVLL